MTRDAWTQYVDRREGAQTVEKRAKYGNVKTQTSAGEDADSRKEARVLEEYRLLEKAGEVQDVKPQYTFPLHVNGRHICDYRADLVFTVNGVLHAVDTKSPRTRTLPEYRIKVKLLRAIHGIEILER